MKIPDNLKDTDKRWDAWRAFHWNFPESSYRSYGHDPIVLFDTGELVVTSSYAALRREYRELDIELAATSAPGFPALTTPDGREIKNAWLTQNGMQEVLIDYATGRVVSLAKRFRTEDNPQIPARFVSDYGQALAYFPGPGQAPVSPSRLIVRPPVQCGQSAVRARTSPGDWARRRA